MKKITDFFKNNILFFFTCFLLAFIPLYPKLPLINVQHTWVYVRVEDFAVLIALTTWIFLVLFKKVKLKTPLTFPMLLFWIIGAISTFHGVLIIFPTLANVFPNVAFLSLIRRMEYMSMFFIAYQALKEKRYLNYVIALLAIVLILIVSYGIGQKLFGFPAYLTGNEEFAKGAPLQLSSLARVTSTFAGSYDLAAYLVLLIPIFVSLIFGFRNWLVKLGLFVTAASGFGLLFLTVSRVSFFVLMLSLVILLLFQKRKFAIIAIISLFAFTLLFLIVSPNLLNRFGKTVSEVKVLVNSNTGTALGQITETPREFFKDKIVLSPGVSIKDIYATTSAVIPFKKIPEIVDVLTPANESTGENLPQGTGYVNLPLSPILKRATQYYLIGKLVDVNGAKIIEVHTFSGNFLVKKAKAYDLSFTTRFQGEWPRTIEAFKKNIFIGSGYGSVSLAVDNDFLRILGESGLLGLISFISIFLIAGIYIKKSLPHVDSPVVRSFVLGFIMGTFGLILNAVLIDVFEASKIAFTYWILMGVTLGTLHFYNKEENINIYHEFKKVLTSPYAVVIYLLLIIVAVLTPLYNNNFVGDDFTWLRWAASSKNNFFDFLTNVNGFFYRPGTRLYFSLMYNLFWLNQTFYHLISIFLHFCVVLLSFVVFRKILKDYALSIIAVVLFLISTGSHEAIFWISSTGFLFNAAFVLLSLWFFILFKEKSKNIYLIFSLVSISLSLLFHEVGVIAPLLLITYDVIFHNNGKIKLFKKIYLILLLPLLPYFILRLFAQSHWFSGDYNYSILKLPFNFIGNAIGYFSLDFFGPQSLRFYEILRNVLRGNIIFATFGFVVITFILFLIYKVFVRKIEKDERKLVIFGFLFFFISLLPFLGLGNIASRYSYLSSIGFVIIFAIFVKKGFKSLLNISDKYITVMISTLIIMIYLSIQLFQLQKIHIDWQTAGLQSQASFISFEGIYKDTWKNQNMHFYFANIPIKVGEAWVFPVGLSDALWFALPNKNFSVDSVLDLNFALNKASLSPDIEVFQFDQNGIIKQVFPEKLLYLNQK